MSCCGLRRLSDGSASPAADNAVGDSDLGRGIGDQNAVVETHDLDQDLNRLDHSLNHVTRITVTEVTYKRRAEGFSK